MILFPYGLMFLQLLNLQLLLFINPVKILFYAHLLDPLNLNILKLFFVFLLVIIEKFNRVFQRCNFFLLLVDDFLGFIDVNSL